MYKMSASYMFVTTKSIILVARYRRNHNKLKSLYGQVKQCYVKSYGNESVKTGIVNGL